MVRLVFGDFGKVECRLTIILLNLTSLRYELRRSPFRGSTNIILKIILRKSTTISRRNTCERGLSNLTAFSI